MIWYRLDLRCPKCERVHVIHNLAQVPGGPAEAGTVAELYPDGRLPSELTWLLRTSVLCEWTGEYVDVDLEDPARVYVAPAA